MSDKIAKPKKKPKKVSKQKQVLQVTNECRNCGAALQLDQLYCSGCGAKRMYNRLNWRNLGEDFANRFLNIENHFIKTFVALFKKPEDVIGGYINGTRKKYISAFGYFTIAVTIAGIYAFVIQNWFIDDFIAAQQASASVSNPIAIGEGVEKQQLQAMTNMLEKINEFTFKYMSLFYFLNIPFMAIISRTVFWNYKRYNYIEPVSYTHLTLPTIYSV